MFFRIISLAKPLSLNVGCNCHHNDWKECFGGWSAHCLCWSCEKLEGLFLHLVILQRRFGFAIIVIVFVVPFSDSEMNQVWLTNLQVHEMGAVRSIQWARIFDWHGLVSESIVQDRYLSLLATLSNFSMISSFATEPLNGFSFAGPSVSSISTDWHCSILAWLCMEGYPFNVHLIPVFLGLVAHADSHFFVFIVIRAPVKRGGSNHLSKVVLIQLSVKLVLHLLAIKVRCNILQDRWGISPFTSFD